MFHVRWRGYDRAEVDEYLRRTTADRQRLQEGLARLDGLIASYQISGPDGTVAAAERAALDIRAKAEEQAHRLLREAKAQAESLERERIDSTRRELDRLTALRREVEASLEASVTMLRRASDLLSTETGRTEPSPRLPKVVTPAASSRPVNPSRLIRSHRRAYGLFASILAGGALFAVLTHQLRSHETVGIPVAGHIERPGVPPESSQREIESVLSNRPADGLTVTLTARRSCWVSALIDGSQRMDRVLQSGEAIFLHVHEETVLKVGDAGALLLRINDRQGKSLGADGQVVTRRITRSDYSNLLEQDPR